MAMPPPSKPPEPSAVRPRVLVVITRGEAGGAQVHVRDLVRGLQHAVDFTVAVGDEEWLTGELRALGVEVHVVSAMQRDVSLGNDLRGLRAIRALIRTVQPALVHTHSSKAGLLGRVAARSLRVPTLHTAHAWSFSEGQPLSRVVAAVPPEWVAGRLTCRFIVVSEADREVGTRYRVAKPAQVRVVHNGVADTPLRAQPGSSGPVLLTMVARMAAPKDHALLLEALRELPGDWRLRLVGDGPDRPAVEGLIAQYGLSARVELLGVRSNVAELLAESHVGLLISKQEGFPLVVLEAMRAGLPVVASDVGGVREAVKPGENGYLVPRSDAGALRHALADLVASADLRRRMGAAARETYTSRFGLPQMLSATLAVYRELLPRGAHE